MSSVLNPFVRRSDAHTLHVSMTGVKMGDRVAFIGCADGARLAAVAAVVQFHQARVYEAKRLPRKTSQNAAVAAAGCARRMTALYQEQGCGDRAVLGLMPSMKICPSRSASVRTRPKPLASSVRWASPLLAKGGADRKSVV